ncbi:hypothetical protein [Rhizobium sp. MHM7A]|uniref:hypothetical protein n=1 Tax=Rhizobium sp. MHM7A TaxID=2583233 RepID=UPI0014874B37|nr:hypothetical protein [Rhizobium sp. MHM7A]
MQSVQEIKDRIVEEVNNLATSVLNARSTFPDFGKTWGPWKEWDGSDPAGPADLEEEKVHVYRSSPLSKLYLVDEAHHIDWTHNGSGDDVRAYRVEIVADYPPTSRFENGDTDD